MFQESTRLCDVKYKIVFLGQSSVGKSAIIERYIQSTFDPTKSQTVGIDFMVKTVHYKGAVYRLQLWDTAGQEKFKSLVPNYIRDAHCAVFVYDVGRRDTFVGIDLWLQLFREHNSGDVVSILVGNKSDLTEKRQVGWQQGVAKAAECSLSFCQTSALTGQGVQQLFFSIIQNIQAPKFVQEPIPQVSTHRRSASTTSSSVNKARLVKIGKQKKQFMCCYI